MKALENGLRGLKLSDSVQLDVRPGPAPAGDRQCGHIRILPVRPDVDRKIIVRPFKPGDASMSRMPVHKGLPPCPSGNR